jgi:hypothetical protein
MMSMASNGKMPTIGRDTQATSYPDPSLAGTIRSSDTSLGSTAHNWNAANFPNDPEVLNASPATKKNYAWNKGETGNANS